MLIGDSPPCPLQAKGAKGPTYTTIDLVKSSCAPIWHQRSLLKMSSRDTENTPFSCQFRALWTVSFFQSEKHRSRLQPLMHQGHTSTSTWIADSRIDPQSPDRLFRTNHVEYQGAAWRPAQSTSPGAPIVHKNPLQRPP